MWGALVGAMEGVVVESDTLGIELRGCILMEGYVGGVDGSVIGAVTGYGRAMVSIHWINRSWRFLIASSWVLQVTTVASIIAHVSMEMEWMMQSYGLIEGCVR